MLITCNGHDITITMCHAIDLLKPQLVYIARASAPSAQ